MQMLIIGLFAAILLACPIVGFCIVRRSPVMGNALILAFVGLVAGFYGPKLVSSWLGIPDGLGIGIVIIFFAGPGGFVFGGLAGAFAGRLARKYGSFIPPIASALGVVVVVFAISFLCFFLSLASNGR